MQIKEIGIFDGMTLSQLNNRKSNYATWMLALVIFLSGFTFSGATEYAKADQAKTRTELVISARTKSYKITVDAFTHHSSTPEFYLSEISQVIRQHNRLSKVQFDLVSKNYLTFSSDLIYNSFFSRTRENEFYPLIG